MIISEPQIKVRMFVMIISECKTMVSVSEMIIGAFEMTISPFEMIIAIVEMIISAVQMIISMTNTMVKIRRQNKLSTINGLMVVVDHGLCD